MDQYGIFQGGLGVPVMLLLYWMALLAIHTGLSAGEAC